MSELILNQGNFDELVMNASKPVLVDFYAPWCGPCKMMSSTIETISDEANGAYLVGKVNIDEEIELANRFSVRSVPTFKVFNNGAITGTHTGTIAKEWLLEMLKRKQ